MLRSRVVPSTVTMLVVACAGPAGAPPGAPAPRRPVEPVPRRQEAAAPLADAGEPDAERPQAPPVWSYVLPIDHGVRSDAAGQGQFLAPRHHGQHNGIDLLAPTGTPVLAACSGSARSGTSGSFGIWVQVVCPIPGALGGDPPVYASLFHSHLRAARVGPGGRHAVECGAEIGEVGKTGNARGAAVRPHLHLEVAIHATEEAALAETHSGRDQSNGPAADAFFGRLSASCLEPSGVGTKGRGPRRARRADPFLVLRCLGVAKPPYEPPTGALRGSSVRWEDLYDLGTLSP